MMGLLDAFDSDEGLLGLSLLAAAGPSAVPRSTGQRMAMAMQAYRGQKAEDEDRRATKAYREMQIEALRQQAAERERKIADARQMQEMLMSRDPTGGMALAARLNPEKAAEMFIPQRGEIGKANPSDFTPESLAQYTRTNDPSVLRRLPPTPTPPAPLELQRLQDLRDTLPPGDPRRAEVQAAINKATQFAPPSTVVNMGYQAPVLSQLPDGRVGYVLPPNKPGGTPEVMSVGGAPVIRPAGGDGKLPAELQRMNIAGQTMGTLLSDYEKWLSKNNPRDLSVQMNPAARADAQSLMKNIQLQFKELQGLGALTGPDVAIMESALSDPFSFKGAFYGPDGLRSQIGRARQLIEERTRATASTQGQPGAPRGADDRPAPRSKIVRLDDGSSVAAELGPDGKYYVMRGGKRYRVEE